MILCASTLPSAADVRIQVCSNDIEVVREPVEGVPVGMPITRMRGQLDHGRGRLLGLGHERQCRMHTRRKRPTSRGGGALVRRGRVPRGRQLQAIDGHRQPPVRMR